MNLNSFIPWARSIAFVSSILVISGFPRDEILNFPGIWNFSRWCNYVQICFKIGLEKIPERSRIHFQSSEIEKSRMNSSAAGTCLDISEVSAVLARCQFTFHESAVRQPCARDESQGEDCGAPEKVTHHRTTLWNIVEMWSLTLNNWKEWSGLSREYPRLLKTDSGNITPSTRKGVLDDNMRRKSQTGRSPQAVLLEFFLRRPWWEQTVVSVTNGRTYRDKRSQALWGRRTFCWVPVTNGHFLPKS
jgi:hypothetical protein